MKTILDQLQVSVSPTALALQYQKMISNMQDQLKKEQELRVEAENEVNKLNDIIKQTATSTGRKKKSILEKRQEREAYQQRQLTGLKKDGKPIAHAGEAIQSYSEFKALSDYLWEIKQYKFWLLWSLGTATGLRISDLIQLKWGFFFKDGQYRERFPKIEQKTGKLNNILITEYMRQSIDKYLQITNIKPVPDNLLFPSRKKFKYDISLSEEENENRRFKKDQEYAKGLSQRLKRYGEDIGLQHKSSHSMRHSFCSIVQCLYNSEYNMDTLETVSGLLNHYDLKTTARYCGLLEKQWDEARIKVSDFLLGRTNVDELKLPVNNSNQNIINLLNEVKTAVQETSVYNKEDY